MERRRKKIQTKFFQLSHRILTILLKLFVVATLHTLILHFYEKSEKWNSILSFLLRLLLHIFSRSLDLIQNKFLLYWQYCRWICMYNLSLSRPHMKQRRQCAFQPHILDRWRWWLDISEDDDMHISKWIKRFYNLQFILLVCLSPLSLIPYSSERSTRNLNFVFTYFLLNLHFKRYLRTKLSSISTLLEVSLVLLWKIVFRFPHDSAESRFILMIDEVILACRNESWERSRQFTISRH